VETLDGPDSRLETKSAAADDDDDEELQVIWIMNLFVFERIFPFLTILRIRMNLPVQRSVLCSKSDAYKKDTSAERLQCQRYGCS
jgi:hypothetical protein